MADIRGIELASEIYGLEDTSARNTATAASQTATQAGQTATQASQTATQASQTATQASQTATQADEKATENANAISELQSGLEDLTSAVTGETAFTANLNSSFVVEGGTCRGITKNKTTFLTFDFVIKSDVALTPTTVLFDNCPIPKNALLPSVLMALNQTDSDIATFLITSNGYLIPGYAVQSFEAGKRYLGYISYLSN